MYDQTADTTARHKQQRWEREKTTTPVSPRPDLTNCSAEMSPPIPDTISSRSQDTTLQNIFKLQADEIELRRQKYYPSVTSNTYVGNTAPDSIDFCC